MVPSCGHKSWLHGSSHRRVGTSHLQWWHFVTKTLKTSANCIYSFLTKLLLISSINQWYQFICVLIFNWLTLGLKSTLFSSTCSRIGSISISPEAWAYFTRHKHDKSQKKVPKIVSFSRFPFLIAWCVSSTLDQYFFWCTIVKNREKMTNLFSFLAKYI